MGGATGAQDSQPRRRRKPQTLSAPRPRPSTHTPARVSYPPGHHPASPHAGPAQSNPAASIPAHPYGGLEGGFKQIDGSTVEVTAPPADVRPACRARAASRRALTACCATTTRHHHPRLPKEPCIMVITHTCILYRHRRHRRARSAGGGGGGLPSATCVWVTHVVIYSVFALLVHPLDRFVCSPCTVHTSTTAAIPPHKQ